MSVTREEAKVIFVPMEAKLRAHEWTDADAFMFIANMCATNIRIAQGFAAEMATLLSEMPGEVTYADVVVQAYFNVLFDPDVSATYGTGWLLSSTHSLKQYVEGFSLTEAEPVPEPSRLILPSRLQ